MIKQYDNISLRDRNSFGFDVRARRLIEFSEAGDLAEIFASIISPSDDWRVISGGNNILFSGDFDGVLLHPVARKIEITHEGADQVFVHAEAGVDWDDFVAWCVERGLWGVENLSYIPGYVGAAPVQNIGAYGCEARDTIASVEMYCVESGTMLTLAADHCGFAYRDSVFKGELKGKVIITAVNFVLSRAGNPKLGYGDLEAGVAAAGGPTLENIRQTVIAIRRSKLPEPSEIGNAGSFFKNPVVDALVAERLRAEYPDMPVYPAGEGEPDNKRKLAAGWLIDRAGWKGYRRGDAGVHERQALVLVNYGRATGAEVLALAADIRSDIRSKFGVEVEMEVNLWVPSGSHFRDTDRAFRSLAD